MPKEGVVVTTAVDFNDEVATRDRLTRDSTCDPAVEVCSGLHTKPAVVHCEQSVDIYRGPGASQATEAHVNCVRKYVSFPSADKSR